jgi:hypothetical protein
MSASGVVAVVATSWPPDLSKPDPIDTASANQKKKICSHLKNSCKISIFAE